MDTYTLTQALLSVGSVYHVRKPPEQDVAFTVRGVLMSSIPKFRLVEGVEGEDGRELGTLTGNFIKTRYEITHGAEPVASLQFPAVAFKKTLTLAVGDEVFEADGGVFRGVFQCTRPDGELVLEITKELSIRDTFVVRVTDAIPLSVGFLAAVAIHSRFYEMV